MRTPVVIIPPPPAANRDDRKFPPHANQDVSSRSRDRRSGVRYYDAARENFRTSIRIVILNKHDNTKCSTYAENLTRDSSHSSRTWLFYTLYR